MSQPQSTSARIAIHVQPGAKRSEVVGRHGDAWKLRVASPPVDGKANDAVVSLLSDVLAVAKRDVTILHGHTGRRKLVEISGLSPADVEARLAAI